jgi:preprotein translocase subunit SecD
LKQRTGFRSPLLIITFLLVIPVSTACNALHSTTVAQGKLTRLGLRLLPESKAPVTEAEIDRTMNIIRPRIEKLSGISVTVERSQVQGEEIAVLLPASIAPEEIKAAMVNPGRLQLKLLAQNSELPYASKAAAEKAAAKLNRSAFEILRYDDGNNRSGWVVADKNSAISGNDLKEVRANESPYGNSNYVIEFLLTPDSAERCSQLTGSQVGYDLAIVLNNEFKSAPRIESAIGARGQISGNFTRQEAQRLAIILGSGELPHELKIVSEKING